MGSDMFLNPPPPPPPPPLHEQVKRLERKYEELNVELNSALSDAAALRGQLKKVKAENTRLKNKLADKVLKDDDAT